MIVKRDEYKGQERKSYSQLRVEKIQRLGKKDVITVEKGDFNVRNGSHNHS